MVHYTDRNGGNVYHAVTYALTRQQMETLGIPASHLVRESLKAWYSYRPMDEATEEQLEAMGLGATPTGEKIEQEANHTGIGEPAQSTEEYVTPFACQS